MPGPVQYPYVRFDVHAQVLARRHEHRRDATADAGLAVTVERLAGPLPPPFQRRLHRTGTGSDPDDLAPDPDVNATADRPFPRCSGWTATSRAQTASGRRPSMTSSAAHMATWSQPPSGNLSRPSTAAANGTEQARATGVPASSSTLTMNRGHLAASLDLLTSPAAMLPCMNTPSDSSYGIANVAAATSGRSARLTVRYAITNHTFWTSVPPARRYPTGVPVSRLDALPGRGPAGGRRVLPGE